MNKLLEWAEKYGYKGISRECESELNKIIEDFIHKDILRNKGIEIDERLEIMKVGNWEDRRFVLKQWKEWLQELLEPSSLTGGKGE